MDRIEELKRLVELRQDVRDLIGEGHTEALEDFRSACIRFDFSWAVAEIERLRTVLEKWEDHRPTLIDAYERGSVQRVSISDLLYETEDVLYGPQEDGDD